MKILIASHYMELGGAETALLGLLETLSRTCHEIDLWIWDKRGPLMKHIPPNIRVIDSPEAYSKVERPIVESLQSNRKEVLWPRIIARVKYLIYRLFRKEREDVSLYAFIDKEIAKTLPSMGHLGRYDYVLAFNGFPYTVAKKTSGRIKIGWVHTDYGSVGIADKLENEIWSLYDYVACVSIDAKKRFDEKLPGVGDKSIVIQNHLPTEYIVKLATQYIVDDVNLMSKRTKLLTVGRFCSAKRMDIIPKISRELIDKGIDLEWWLIGYGPDEKKIRENIRREKMEERVKILGRKDNPYPYFRLCDYYVQPSAYEGCSVAVREAQLLGCKVIITDYPTANSQINSSLKGWVVPMDIDPCIEAIYRILSNSQN